MSLDKQFMKIQLHPVLDIITIVFMKGKSASGQKIHPCKKYFTVNLKDFTIYHPAKLMIKISIISIKIQTL